MSEANVLQGSTPSGEVTYWRSLDQLAGNDEFHDLLHREFPDGIADAPDEPTRRSFLTAIAASVALAGLTSCRKPTTHILPFNRRPEGYKPGIAQHYATALSRGGYAIGVLVRSNDGRPTKIEGNPLHPSSLGGSDALLQGELLNLYDPDRSTMPRRRSTAAGEGHGDTAHGGEHAGGETPAGEGHGAAATTDVLAQEFHSWWSGVLKTLTPKKGDGLRFLMPPTASPSLAYLQQKLKENLPEAQFHTWEPLHRDSELAGSQTAFGKALNTNVSYDKADVVVAFDCDFLALDGANLSNARNWAKKRRPESALSRLYVVESCFSTTGTAADHRFRMRSSEIPAAVFALAAALGIGGDVGVAAAAHKSDAYQKGGKNWLQAIAKDLQAARGRAVVVAGPRQPPVVHAAVHAINAALDAVNRTVSYAATPAGLAHGQVESIRTLKAEIEAGKVEVLVCLGTNPVYDAPADLGFGKLLKDKKVAHTIHLGQYLDETGELCDWHINLAHELEAWGDGRAHDGTLTIQQPLVAPLHGAVSALEFIGYMAEQADFEKTLLSARDTTYGHDLLKAYWRAASAAVDFDSWWANALHAGIVAGTEFAIETPQLNAVSIAAAIKSWSRPQADIEVTLRADAKLWDGRYANNSWLQELSDPLTKLTWDNAALVSARTAEKLGVKMGDKLTITVGTTAIDIAAFVLPGHADDSVSIPLGYGRSLQHAKVAKGAGFDAFPLRRSDSQWLVVGARVGKGGGTPYKLVCTQEHGTMAGRALVRESTAEQYRSDPEWAPKMSSLDKAARLHGKVEKDLIKSLWPDRGYDKGAQSPDPQVARTPYQWGMTIDLNVCTGCSACVVACFAENNIPMVGKTQVARNREMTWIRMDRYFTSRRRARRPARPKRSPSATSSTR
jgi:molybdopterin-containing oxidoreductase family iron-sulfur binding subunit